jgi:hypothetical protein
LATDDPLARRRHLRLTDLADRMVASFHKSLPRQRICGPIAVDPRLKRSTR